MPANAILSRMLDRLFASMARGPCLNCRPHASRQRIDLTLIGNLKDIAPDRVLTDLLSEKREVSIAAKVPSPPNTSAVDRLKMMAGINATELDQKDNESHAPQEDSKNAATQEWIAQRALLTKLRNMSDDARTYEQDTGVHALHLGFPILSLPPGIVGRGSSSRVLAPIAFIPVSLAVRTGHKPGIDLSCCGEGIDLVIPNTALLAWLERQTGKPVKELLNDEEGEKPWQEVAAMLRSVCAMLDLNVVETMANSTQAQSQDSPSLPIDPTTIILDQFINPEKLKLNALPKTDELGDKPVVYASAVLGLFPMTNESLLRDTQAMIEAPKLQGPVLSFVNSNVQLETSAEPEIQEKNDQIVAKDSRRFETERLVASADPCQSRTVAKARSARGLVVHGPPGTGKSQTITNIIGDHLARGERVLFVCDKRTALDVVANRLNHLGLGSLCALVHDPQRDQRDLYMSVRAQLDELAETKTNPKAQAMLKKIDEELQQLHSELTQAHRALMVAPDAHGSSFHELMGEWMSIDQSAMSLLDDTNTDRIALHDLDASAHDLGVILQRGLSVKYPENPWVHAAGISLEKFLAQPAVGLRRSLASCVEDGRAADDTRHEDIPPFNPQQPLSDQSNCRQKLAAILRQITQQVDAATSSRLAVMNDEQVRKLNQQLNEAQPNLQMLKEGSLDSELLLVVRENPPGHAAIAQQLGAINEYLPISNTWHAFLHFGAKSRASKVVRQFGLPFNADSAQRVRKFLNGWRARLMLSDICRAIQGLSTASPAMLLSDDEIVRTFSNHQIVIDALNLASNDAELKQRTLKVLANHSAAASFINGLELSMPRAAALQQLESSLENLQLINSKWLASATAQVRAGRKILETLVKMEEHFDSLESVLRIQNDLGKLKPELRRPCESLLKNSADVEGGLAALRKGALAGEIGRRLSGDAILSKFEGERLAATFARYAKLDAAKRECVRDVILHHWRTIQKERLLVSTGTRLNGEGAKLKQRLFVRGSRAMRLRQVIAIGQGNNLNQNDENEHSSPQAEFSPQSNAIADPLFDLCPVWMASPETVAQVFPRRPLFDVVIFDEASQCRLEEALPVLTRAGRVVIAGDPKQLPPTRFFESAIVESDDAVLETDQDLFETRQGEIEDLLTAALNLEIEESYLDVHYRSRNAALIEFSNEQFYGSRLQAIPGHPSNRTRFAPITLQRVDGIYEKRCNVPEAKRVCEIVRDLLKRATPPSIGIACFNLAQRDLIVEMLDDMAVEDSTFAAKLAAARERRGEGSFEGLFVKNLENVQGDERDHIIISTTYGPNKDGKFYRRFGPLGMPGGGRRLNVLVTRARHEIHLVTSIPREAYLNLPPIPAGQTPNGGWLLFAYLRFAEGLQDLYETNHRILSEAVATQAGRVNEIPIQPVSQFALGVGAQLATEKKLASDVHWGNEGFRIDVALLHPKRAEDVTVGLLCDFAQYTRAQDAVEWDMFRTMVHESQGWQLQRIWSPHYFRDSAKVVNTVTKSVNEFLQSETESQLKRPT